MKPLQSSKALNTGRARLGPSPFQEPAVGKQEAQVQDKEQKSQGNVTSVVTSTHAKVPSAWFFFFPFEISNSSLWTKSCLSENIDLQPLTKLHFKQSRGLLSSPCPRTCLLSPWISQDHAENFALEHSTGTCTKRILFLMSAASFLGRTSGITR